MQKILRGVEGCDVIMDDILVWGATKEEHDERLKIVQERIKASGLTLNEEKSQIGKEKVKFFGHELSKQGIKPSPEKVEAILKLPPPTSVKELRSLCGMLNYLSKFAPHLASVMKPMTDLLKADVSWTWDHPQQEAFEAAKQLVSNLPSLSYYSIGSDVIVSADASGYGLGAVLLQRKGDALSNCVCFSNANRC